MKFFTIYEIKNKINNNIYIGCHITENINDNYMGSGVNIKNAIKNEGIDNFEKKTIYIFDNKEKMLSKEKEIVNDVFIKREDTYNIIPGGGVLNTYGKVVVKRNNKYILIDKKDYNNSIYETVLSNKVMVRTKDNKIILINNDDKRYLSSELKFISCGKIIVKDKNNKTLQVDKDDERYLSGELVGLWKNKKHTDETKRKISEKNKIYIGEKNSQYNTIWISNLSLKKCIKIKKDDLEKYNGWIIKRIMNFELYEKIEKEKIEKNIRQKKDNSSKEKKKNKERKSKEDSKIKYNISKHKEAEKTFNDFITGNFTSLRNYSSVKNTYPMYFSKLWSRWIINYNKLIISKSKNNSSSDVLKRLNNNTDE